MLVPGFCLVMPFRNEAEHLGAVLESIAAQTVTPERIRLVAVDNGSTDGGADVVRSWAFKTGIQATVLHVERPSIPTALNHGVRLARTDEFVVRLDAHTLYGSTYLERIEKAFAELPEHVWCVGGAQQVLSTHGNWGEAIVASLMTNPLGLGGASWRTATSPREVESAYLGAWRPGVFAKIGGFDDRWRANEDGELAARIREHGGKVWYAPLPCRYRIKRGPLRTLAQWRRYGFWRARTILRHRSALRLRHFAPPAELFIGISLALSPWRAALVPLALLFATLVIVRRPPGEPASVTAGAIIYFPLAHIAFALGLVSGLLTGIPTRAALRAPAPFAATAEER